MAPHAHRPERRLSTLPWVLHRPSSSLVRAAAQAPDHVVPRRHRRRRLDGRRPPAPGEVPRRRRHYRRRPRGGHLGGPPMAGVAILNAGIAVLGGWLSSRIGEGLILDLRTGVFGHVQRQSLAFFTRTQTGALVSRLNNDVIGAQRAFTSTLGSTVSNSIAVVVVGTRCSHSVGRSRCCACCCSRCCSLSRWVGTGCRPHPPADGRQRRLGNVMTERFNVGGAMLLKLFGRREEEDRQFADKAGDRPRPRRPHLPRHPDLRRRHGPVPALATALVYGVGGHLAIEGDSPSAPCSPSPRCCCGSSGPCRDCPTCGSTS